MHYKLFLFLLALTISLNSFGQQSRKVGFKVGSGISGVNGSANSNQFGATNKAFENVSGGFLLGTGVFYQLDPKWNLDFDITYFSGGQDTSTTMRMVSNILGVTRHFSGKRNWRPYFKAGLGVDIASISRAGFVVEEVFTGQSNDGSIVVRRRETIVPQKNVSAAIIPAYEIAMGMETKLSDRISLTGELALHRGFAGRNTAIRNVFPQHNQRLRMFQLKLGLKFYLKKKKPHIDSTAIPLIVHLDSLEGKFLYRILGQVKGDTNVEGTRIVLTDKERNEVAVAFVDGKGYFEFKELKSDDYLIFTDSEVKSLETSYYSSEQINLYSLDQNDFNTIKKKYGLDDAQNFIITGTSKKLREGQEILLVSDDRAQIQRTVSNENGTFLFKTLKEDSYYIVFEDYSKNIDADIKLIPESEPFHVLKKDLRDYDYKLLPEDISTHIIGAIHADEKELENSVVLLLDKDGNVIASTIAQEGTFVFSQLPLDDYQLIFEDPKLKQQTEVTYVTETKDHIFASLKQYGYDSLAHDQIDLLAGQVLLKDNKRPDSLFVMILDRSGQLMKTVKTDSNGYFIFKYLPNEIGRITLSDPSLADSIRFVTIPAEEILTEKNLSNYKYKLLEKDKSINLSKKELILMGQFEDHQKGDMAILLDDQDQIVDITKAGKDGYFVFRHLDPNKKYHMLSSDGKKLISSTMKAIDSSAYISTHQFKKLQTEQSSNLVLLGKLITDGEKPNSENWVMLVDERGDIVKVVDISGDGYFVYEKLAKDQGLVVIGLGNKPLVEADWKVVEDNSITSIKEGDIEKFSYNKLQSDTAHNLKQVYTINALARYKGTNKPLVNERVILVDDEGNILDEATTNEEGVFAFERLKPEGYRIVYPNAKQLIATNFQLFDEKIDLKTDIDLETDTLLLTVYYEKNQYKLTTAHKSRLNNLLKYIKEHEKEIKEIKLNSYGDASGSVEYNLELTDKRANEVATFLKENNVKKDLLHPVGFGKSLAVKSKDSKSDPKLNRKTDIKIYY